MLVLGLSCGFLTIHDGDSTNDVFDDSGEGTDEGAAWCDEFHDTGPPVGPDCFSGTLACGETLEASTEGGASQFASEDYTSNFCFPNLDQSSYAGPERVYLVALESGVEGVISVSADCAALGVAVMRWSDATTCPVETAVPSCEGDEGTGGTSIAFGGFESSNQWVVVVDTRDEESAAFRLVLTCD